MMEKETTANTALLTTNLGIHAENQMQKKIITLLLLGVFCAFVCLLVNLHIWLSIQEKKNQRRQGLYDAVRNKEFKSVEYWLDEGADVNEVYGSGSDAETPLSMAIGSQSNDIVELLLTRGADPNLACRWGVPIHQAAERGNSTAFFLLEKHGAKISPYLMYPAVSGGNTEIVQHLVDQGIDPNTMPGSCAPLHLAGTAEMASLLIALGARIDAKDDKGQTPLHYAARRNRPEVCQILLDKATDVNARDNFARTPLHMVVFDNTAFSKTYGIPCAKFLLEHGADINARDQHGQTALHYAIEHRYDAVVELLLANGADVHATDNDGNTAMDILRSPDSPIGQLLQEAAEGSGSDGE